MIPNYYQRLGLGKSATKEEIKKAYRKYALEYHPDRNKNADAHQKFIEINEAYLILNDEEARVKYDREYDFYFQPKAAESNKSYQWKEDTYAQESKEREYEYKSTFSDEDLNNWAKNARAQGQDFAKMAFNEFSKQVLGFVKETGFQLGNTLIVFFGILFTMAGCGNLVVGLATGSEIGNPILGIVMLPIGIILYRYANKKWDNRAE